MSTAIPIQREYSRQTLRFPPNRVASLAVGIFLLASCGSVGEPLPPLVNIPERSGDFRVRQVAGRIVLSWTWPLATTEGMPLRDLAIFRVHAMPLGAPDDLPPPDVFERESQELVLLTADELSSYRPGDRIERTIPAGPMAGQILAMAVRGESRRGRSAGFSDLSVVDVIDPPLSPASPRADLAEDAIVLEWEPVSGAGSYQVQRAMEAGGPFTEIGRAEGPPFRDTEFAWGREYFYRLISMAQSRTGEVEGAASGTVKILAQDRFAPRTPQAVRVVTGRTSVEISWAHNTEQDLAGYRLRRSEGSAGPEPLQEGLLNAANFTDTNVRPGRSYSYSVSAVDKEGNESQPSPAVSVDLP